MTNRIEIIWPDGSRTTGNSWKTVERAIRAAQWHTYKSRHEFRRDMQSRCAVWTGHTPTAIWGSAEAFIKSMARTGAILVNQEEK